MPLLVEITQKQKEARISYLQNRIEQITKQLEDPASPIHEIYSNESPKRDMILKWAQYVEELHELGVYKEPLTSISSHITKEMRRMGLSQGVEYVRKILPVKYKDESKDFREDAESSGIDSRQNSSSENEKDNEEYLEMIDETIKFLKFARSKIAPIAFMSILSYEEMAEFFTVHKQAIKTGYLAFNNKKKDMQNTQAILVNVMAHATTTHGAGEYLAKIKNMYEFTGKQAGKILKLEARDIHPLYDPKDRYEAMKVGFYGQRCGDCGSWRVKLLGTDTIGKTRERFHINVPKEFLCFCFGCRTWFDPRTEVIKIIKK